MLSRNSPNVRDGGSAKSLTQLSWGLFRWKKVMADIPEGKINLTISLNTYN